MKLHGPRTYCRMIWRGLHGNHVIAEPKVWKVMKQIHGDLFVDIGANQGVYSLGLRKNFRHVIAFEPNPSTLQILLEKTKSMRNITIKELALSDHEGTTQFYPNTDNGMGAADTILPVFHYRPDHPVDGRPLDDTYVGKDPIWVKTSTYDRTIRTVAALVKIDVEGAEFLVLQGMTDALEHGRIKRIMIELHDKTMKSRLESILRGFQTRWIDSDHLYGIKRGAFEKWAFGGGKIQRKCGE